MFNAQEERLRIYDLLVPLIEHEREINKEQLIKRSINVALEELKEFEQHFNKFLDTVSHLVIYKEVIRQPLTTNIQKLMLDMATLVEKNYTSDELDKMPRDLYNQVIKQQAQRVDLIKKIANIYVKPNKTPNMKEEDK